MKVPRDKDTTTLTQSNALAGSGRLGRHLGLVPLHQVATPINSPLEVEGLLAAIACSGRASTSTVVVEPTEYPLFILLYELGVVQPISQGQEEEEEQGA